MPAEIKYIQLCQSKGSNGTSEIVNEQCDLTSSPFQETTTSNSDCLFGSSGHVLVMRLSALSLVLISQH